MTEIKFSARAFCKIILHATKYPHCAINGILLAKSQAASNKEVEFVDAVPLFHICLNLTPMAEIAIMQVCCVVTLNGYIILRYSFCRLMNLLQAEVSLLLAITQQMKI